jgi:hypothetical protein
MVDQCQTLNPKQVLQSIANLYYSKKVKASNDCKRVMRKRKEG